MCLCFLIFKSKTYNMIDKENKITMLMYESLKNKYLSEMKSAEASLMVYFTYSVGIGEHPQHVEEMDKLVEKIANAQDKLETLETFYKYN